MLIHVEFTHFTKGEQNTKENTEQRPNFSPINFQFQVRSYNKIHQMSGNYLESKVFEIMKDLISVTEDECLMPK